MANLVEIESSILKYWQENKIYDKVRARNQNGAPFFFTDGPPYATGQIHPGTAWNKCIKDAVLRHHRAKGERVRDQPGFDTHGLPIEVKVEQELKLTNKKDIEKIGVDKFIAQCKGFASQYIGIISSQFARCGVWMDWDNPYITYKDPYIESIWGTIKAADDKGLLTEGVYVVPQCIRCETSLANYELEYAEQDDPSVYVKFKVKGTANEYLVIWTTTPWTLVANMAVMVHPTHPYVKVKVRDEVWIVAKERLEAVMAFNQLEPFTILGELSGKKLEGTEYETPLQPKITKQYPRKVILSDEYVTMDDGSGLVHAAPGHGPEDFTVCRRFGIEVFCPVDAAGRYTAEAGEYAGASVLASKGRIIEDLDAMGALVHAGKIRHRYPHCWRCKTPLIFIATHQWFIAVTKLKEKMLDEIDHTITFRPDFAKTRFRDFVATAPDWCISRQRYWGAPLPIWVCEKKECGKRRILSSRQELPDPKIELHRPFIDGVTFPCPCGGTLRRVPDILDVWFDSGNAVWAQLSPDELRGPGESLQAEFIVEGKDQTRGWFYSLLGSGAVRQGETPYKNLLMHGFFVDEKGEKMSKSVGNFVPLEDILSKYGADTFRLWGLSATTWDDLRFSYASLDENRRTLDIVLNLSVWMERFYAPPGREIPPSELELEDRWLRSRTQGVIEAVSGAFDRYEPHAGLVALREFLVEDVSRFYLKRLKTRINSGERNPAAGMATLHDSLRACTILLSPYCPFVAEHIYLSTFRKSEQAESVSLLPWPSPQSAHRDLLLEQQIGHVRDLLNACANARARANFKLRWPAEEARIATSSTELRTAVERAAPLIEAMANVRRVSLGAPPSVHSVELAHAKIGARFKADTPQAMAALQKLSPQEIVEGLGGPQPWMLDGKFHIDETLVKVSESSTGYSVAEFEGGKAYVKTVMDAGLYAEAMGRELMRRIQSMRKEMDLQPSDPIAVWLAGDAELLKAAAAREAEIRGVVNARTLECASAPAEADLIKEWDIEDMAVKIALKRL